MGTDSNEKWKIVEQKVFIETGARARYRAGEDVEIRKDREENTG